MTEGQRKLLRKLSVQDMPSDIGMSAVNADNLAKLEANGLVFRSRQEGDDEFFSWSITDAGLAVLSK